MTTQTTIFLWRYESLVVIINQLNKKYNHLNIGMAPMSIWNRKKFKKLYKKTYIWAMIPELMQLNNIFLFKTAWSTRTNTNVKTLKRNFSKSETNVLEFSFSKDRMYFFNPRASLSIGVAWNEQTTHSYKITLLKGNVYLFTYFSS